VRTPSARSVARASWLRVSSLRPVLPHRTPAAVVLDACGRLVGHSLARAWRPIPSTGTSTSVAPDDSNCHAKRGARYRVRASPSLRRPRLYRRTRAPAHGGPCVCHAWHPRLSTWTARPSCVTPAAVLVGRRICHPWHVHPRGTWADLSRV